MSNGLWIHMILMIIFSFIGITVQSNDEPTLKQVVIISRHGSRGFLTKHHKTFQEGENSELTVRGMNQMFKAGQYVRHRYNGTATNFLKAEYNASDIYVRSSDYSRTLVSAQSFLLGLYPPRRQAQNTSQPLGMYQAPYDIQQIPVHTVAVENDQLLRGWMLCPVFQKRIDQFYESEMFKKKEKDNEDFLKTLGAITGLENIALKDFYNMYDFIHLHLAYGHLYLNITNTQWHKVMELADWLEYHKYNKNMIQDLGAGLLINQIIHNFNNIKESIQKPKLLYYSAHYPTILSLFTVLGVNEQYKELQTVPYYASLVFLELYNDRNDKYYVKFAFGNGLQNDTGKDPFSYYTIPGCGSDMCPLNKFVDLFQSSVPDISSWCSGCGNTDLGACQRGTDSYKSKKTMTAVGGFFTGFFVCLVSIIFLVSSWHFCIKKRCLNRRRPRHGLPEYEQRPSGAI